MGFSRFVTISYNTGEFLYFHLVHVFTGEQRERNAGRGNVGEVVKYDGHAFHWHNASNMTIYLV